MEPLGNQLSLLFSLSVTSAYVPTKEAGSSVVPQYMGGTLIQHIALGPTESGYLGGEGREGGCKDSIPGSAACL